MASEQAGLDLEVLTRELELERRKNRDLPHEILAAEAHKAETLESKVGRESFPAFPFIVPTVVFAYGAVIEPLLFFAHCFAAVNA